MNIPIVKLPPPLPSHIIAKPWWFDIPPMASFWFPNIESKAACMKALSLADTQQLLLQSGEYQLAVNIFIGTRELSQLPGDRTRIFYLWSRMFSGEAYFLRPESFAELDNYSFCLLTTTQLKRFESESSLIAEFYSNGNRVFHTTPFQARSAEEDYPILHQWLAKLVLLINVRQLKSISAQRLETASTYASHLLTLRPSQRPSLRRPKGLIQRPEQLITLLALRQHGAFLSKYIGQAAATQEEGEALFEPLPNELHTIALTSTDKTYQHEHNNMPFNPTLGDQVLPELRKARQELIAFAEKLQQSPHEPLLPIGQEIAGHLEEKIPILALIGTFSSGKTTLLNSLLIGKAQGKMRAFRTKPGANTAIVSEITHVDTGKGTEKTNQRVVFDYRQRIKDFPLAIITPELHTTSISSDDIQEIAQLLEKGVLARPKLRIMPVNPQKSAKSAEIHAKDEIQKLLRYLLQINLKVAQDIVSEHNQANRRDTGSRGAFHKDNEEEGVYTFSADVVDDALAREYLRRPGEQEEHRLPREIDLTTDEGWKDFLGKPDAPSQGAQQGGRVSRRQNIEYRHWTETNLVSLLIERSRVYLNHNLLELTTIADTPGTDSLHFVHDYVTKGYLQDAAAYLLLLPTHIDASERVSNILKEVARALKGDLRRIAFVINCWPIDEKTDIKKKIEDYRQRLCSAFGVTPIQLNALQNFFVVQLKDVEQRERSGNLHGYPSLIQLQIWVERTFRSGAYRARYDQVLESLEGGWQQRYEACVQKLRDFYENAERIRQQCERLRQFLRELQTITDTRLDDIRTFRDSFTTHGYRVTRMMRERGAYPKNFKKPEELMPWRDALKAEYRELNDSLRSLDNMHTLETWIVQVKDKARFLPIVLPALVPEDPAAQSREWSRGRHFDVDDVDWKFAQVAEKWPKNWWERTVEAVKGAFTKDSRIILVEELQEFWDDQYAAIWSKRLETYLQRCEAFLEKQQQAIQAITQERLEELERQNDPEQRKKLEQKYKQQISAFEALEPERRQLREHLAYALA